LKSPVILRIFKDSKLIEMKQFDSDQIIIGHDAEVQVDLQDASVSPIHCLIELRDSGYYICDLGSQSGTFKNGKQVLDEPLSSGDTIVIGAFSIQFFVGIPKPKAPPALTVAPPPAPPTPQKAASQAPPVASLKPAAAPAPAPPKLPDQPVRPQGRSNGTKSEKKQKGMKTFAPPSETRDLRDYLKPTKGTTLEVVVAWKERVLQTYHFTGKLKTIKAGPTNKSQVVIPSTFQATAAPLVVSNGGQTLVVAGAGVNVETITTSQKFSLEDLVRIGKANRSGNGHAVRLDQGDLVCLSYGDGTLQVFIRSIPAAPIPVIASLLDLNGSELTGMIVSVVIVSLLALYMSVYTPSPKEEEKPEEQVRLAQFVYNTPTPTPTPPEQVKKEMPVAEATPRQQPTPEPKKIKVTEEKKEQKVAGNKESTAAVKERPAERASEVRPNPSKLNRPKKFTSVKQGGAVKVGNTAGANANAPNDVTKTGLLSAFGGGNRTKLDQAYTGTGELLGMADKATGTSGQNENRAGDDIGSKFKDAGAGGKGTATQGIAGIGTKGRGSGQAAYGGVGFGGKGNVSIDAGGTDADFVGTIDKEAVRRVIRSILSQIKSCYERQLRSNSNLEGKVIITFEIEEQGRVRIAKTKTSTLGDSNVESCVAMRIKEQRFPEPPPGTVAVVDYPFVFGAQR
jgi:outer membrane biosynthesis protein TonB